MVCDVIPPPPYPQYFLNGFRRFTKWAFVKSGGTVPSMVPAPATNGAKMTTLCLRMYIILLYCIFQSRSHVWPSGTQLIILLISSIIYIKLCKLLEKQPKLDFFSISMEPQIKFWFRPFWLTFSSSYWFLM